MYEFRLPDTGEGIAEAEVIEWRVHIGDSVKEGDVVAIVSTDKVNVDLTSPRSGTVVEICAKAGEIAPVGKIILRIDDGSSSPTSPTPVAAQSRSVGQSQASAPTEGAVRARAAPAVRRYAAAQGVDLDLILGSGSEGLILREDVDAFNWETQRKPHIDSTISPVRERLSGARLKAAQTLSRAAHTMAISTISVELVADALLESRAPSDAIENSPQPLKPFALIVQCVVRTLLKHPRCNARIAEEDNELVIDPHVNLGIAIATGAGLVVPVIANAERMSAQELDTSIADLARRARAGQLDVNRDMRPSTFVVSNTGGLEQLRVISTTPLVYYPTVAMLWLSRITQRPWVKSGSIVVANVLSCTMAFDHRYLNGSDVLGLLNDLNKEFGNGDAV
jgi:pyruvate/2-oxoglutarate dehydrogenase complex dihydrolipoamide acyltransferase (E2) component